MPDVPKFIPPARKGMHAPVSRVGVGVTSPKEPLLPLDLADLSVYGVSRVVEGYTLAIPKHRPPKLLTARARTARVEKVALECQALCSEQRLEGRSRRVLTVGGAIAYALRAELLGGVPK